MKHKNRYATPLKKGYPADPVSETDAVLVIDNYDSFTYNLVHAIKKISGLRVDVVRNDAIELDEKYADVGVKRFIDYVGSDDDVHLIRDGVKTPYKKLEIPT